MNFVFCSNLISGNRELDYSPRPAVALGPLQQGSNIYKDCQPSNISDCDWRWQLIISINEMSVLNYSSITEILGKNFQLGSFAVNTVFPGGSAMVFAFIHFTLPIGTFLILLWIAESPCWLPILGSIQPARKLARHHEGPAKFWFPSFLEHAGTKPTF